MRVGTPREAWCFSLGWIFSFPASKPQVFVLSPVDASPCSWAQWACSDRNELGRRGTEVAQKQVQNKVLALRNCSLNLRWAIPPAFPRWDGKLESLANVASLKRFFL